MASAKSCTNGCVRRLACVPPTLRVVIVPSVISDQRRTHPFLSSAKVSSLSTNVMSWWTRPPWYTPYAAR